MFDSEAEMAVILEGVKDLYNPNVTTHWIGGSSTVKGSFTFDNYIPVDNSGNFFCLIHFEA